MPLSLTLLFLLLCLLPPSSGAADAEWVITTGPRGEHYHAIGQRLRQLLRGQQISAEVRTSAGSLENLERLNDPKNPADIGFSQADILKSYLRDQPELAGKLLILDKVGKQCVFVIVAADSELRDEQDLQRKQRGYQLAIANADSEAALTYKYMSLLEPRFKRTTVLYLDTQKALRRLKAGGGDNKLKAVLLVQRPRLRSPELQAVLNNPDDYRLLTIEDRSLRDKLPNGDPVYSFETVTLLRGGVAPGASVRTLCTPTLLLAARDKLSAEQRKRLTDFIEDQWMTVYNPD